MTFKGAGHGPETTFVSSFFMQNHILEKVAVCNANGDLKLSNNILHKLIMETKFSLEQLRPTHRGIYNAIRFASFCRTHGDEREAIGIMHTVMRSLPTIKKNSPRQFRHLRELAIREISSLWYSTDDYVWEEASQMLSSLQLF